MPKRQNEHLSLGDALREFVGEHKLQKGLDKVQVREAWASLMGNGVNNYTSEVILRGDILLVRLTSSVLREELSYGKSKIIELLNQELGKDIIKKIELR